MLGSSKEIGRFIQSKNYILRFYRFIDGEITKDLGESIDFGLYIVVLNLLHFEE